MIASGLLLLASACGGPGFTDTRANLTGVEPVPGLGEEAFWGTNGLHVLDDDVYLTISVGNTNSPGNLELARGIAFTVVSRLRAAATGFR